MTKSERITYSLAARISEEVWRTIIQGWQVRCRKRPGMHANFDATITVSELVFDDELSAVLDAYEPFTLSSYQGKLRLFKITHEKKLLNFLRARASSALTLHKPASQ